MFHLGYCKQIFWLVKTIFYISFETPASESFFFHLMETYFWNESYIPTIREGFSVYYELSTLLESFFVLLETVTDMNANQVFKDRSCSSWWKLILWLVETIFFPCLRYFSRRPSSPLMETHFSIQKKTSCF